jgi:hypothetical protein
MKIIGLTSRVAVLGLILACLVPPVVRAEGESSEPPKVPPAEVSKRVDDLQKEIERLQSELLTLKKQVSESSAPSAAPTPSLLASSSPDPPAATPAAPSPPPAGGWPASLDLKAFVDGYYNYNFNQPRPRVSSLRAFDGPSNQFALNLIELTLAKSPDATNSRLGFNLTLGYGNAMNVVNSTDPGGLGFAQYLKEAYFSYLAPVGKGLLVDFGKFVTQHGAEVIESKDNWNYSRGLLFTYAIPFYHFGLRAKYAFSDKYQVTGYLVNGWNNIVDNNTGKTFGVQVGWNPTKKLAVVQNYMLGPEQPANNQNLRQLTDTVVTYSPTTRLSLMLNYDYGRGDRIAGLPRPVWWSGAAGYARYAFSSRYAVATRYEYYDDHDGFTTGAVQHLNEFTGTFERLIAGHLITRLEFRRDISNQPSFLKGNLPVSGQNTMAGGLIFVFDSQETK